MSLTQTLREYVSACFTGIWIESHEHEDALADIARLCHDEDWRLARWNISSGLSTGGINSAEDPAGTDPLAAVRALSRLADSEGTALLVLQNFHRFLNSAEIVQAMVDQIVIGKQKRAFVIVLSPVVQIPTELEKLMVVIEHELPGRQQLAEIAGDIATEDGELPDDAGLSAILDAASGLTRYEAEGAFSLALVRHGSLRPQEIWELKSQALMTSGLLSLHRGQERFADLGGLDSLKSFCLRAMRRQNNPDPLRRPRGVMLLSPPGCGKSQFCKALGYETGRPTLILDIGRLMGSLVGQSEERTRQALRIIDAMQPAVVMLDEVEKALSGVSSSGQTDSGVSSRLFGTLLSWLNDRQSDVFVVCTCNDISKLPPEFARSERFDGVFFVDLPSPKQREAIWNIYMSLFGLESQPRPQDDLWTGAEVRSCCRLAALLDVPLLAAAQNVVPVAITAAESVEGLRRWASGRCLDADAGGIYEFAAAKRGKRRRRIQSPDPSQN